MDLYNRLKLIVAIMAEQKLCEQNQPSWVPPLWRQRRYPTNTPVATFHLMWMDLFLVYPDLFCYKKDNHFTCVFHYKTLRETNSIPYPSTKQKRCIFQLSRIKLASSWHTSGTSKHSLDVCKIVLHFEANKNIIWLHTANNLISLLWDTGASGHKVLFASTELDLFIILHKIASLWMF